MRSHLNLGLDDRKRELVMEYVAQATAYAEHVMGCSLMPRTITATYEADDELVLPRGPVIVVNAVTDANGVAVPFHRRDIGNATRLAVRTTSYPLTVVYEAGYSTVPADIAGAIRIHAATLFLVREDAIINGSVASVHKIDAFYAARSRGAPVA